MDPKERKRNPIIHSGLGGRVLSAAQLPLFTLRPPRNYGVLTTTGRKTGKSRRRCVRAVRKGDRVFLVSIHGERTGWARNIRANPEVELRVRGGRFRGVAREPRDQAEREEAIRAYCGAPIGITERGEYRLWRQGRPNREEIDDLHRTWLEHGTPFVVDLSAER
jgi:deazaflavin-dependent oxidoreductase (nitroreductase family)